VHRYLIVDEVLVRFLVDGRLDDGVGQRQVITAQALLEGDEIVVALLVAAVGSRPAGRVGGEASECDVHVVGGPTHDAHAQLGDVAERDAAAFEVGRRSRHLVRDADRFSRLVVFHEMDVRVRELEVVVGRDGCRAAGEHRMPDDVVDAFSAHPDLAVGRLQAFEI
jgi:hypothetical protein